MIEKENKKNDPILARLAYIFTPNMMISIWMLFVVIQSYQQMEQSGGWSYLGVMFALPILIVSLLLDLLTRKLLKKDFLYIWIAELILITIAILIYFNLVE